jgi:hypothetical protein
MADSSWKVEAFGPSQFNGGKLVTFSVASDGSGVGFGHSTLLVRLHVSSDFDAPTYAIERCEMISALKKVLAMLEAETAGEDEDVEGDEYEEDDEEGGGIR